MSVQSEIIFLMGVSGCGKTTIGKRLAAELSLPFFDANDLHSEFNIQKMRSGEPLNDSDRGPWLQSINRLAREQESKAGCVIACSALKASYRTVLERDLGHVLWVLLDGGFDLILERIAGRKDHFMPASLLRSQFEALERPSSAIRVSACHGVPEILASIMKELETDG